MPSGKWWILEMSTPMVFQFLGDLFRPKKQIFEIVFDLLDFNSFLCDWKLETGAGIQKLIKTLLRSFLDSLIQIFERKLFLRRFFECKPCFKEDTMMKQQFLGPKSWRKPKFDWNIKICILLSFVNLTILWL